MYNDGIMTRESNRKYQPKILEFTPEAGEVLRQSCRRLAKEEILSTEIQNLIADMKYTIQRVEKGVGLTANQVHRQEAISVVSIKPTSKYSKLEKIYINTEIVETFGKLVPRWEGCLSTAQDENGEPSMAQVPRYKKIRVRYLDERGNQREEISEGFVAHILQHETDHLNGILFTDLIDKKDLISYREYAKKFARRD